MSQWKETEWRIPRRGEVVRDNDGNLGRVVKSEGNFVQRFLWIENVHGTEIYSREAAEYFQVVSTDESYAWQHQRFNNMGYHVGALCSFKGDLDIPLEILQMDWSNLHYTMTFCLKDYREFDSAIMKTDDYAKIPVLNLNLPDINSIISSEDSGLSHRIHLNLGETGRTGWTNGGSVWEFVSKESALNEVESWKARLKIRRIASVINGDWKVQFPAWKIDIQDNDGILTPRVSKIDHYNGSPAYFRTALHATQAIKMTTSHEWKLAFISSHDHLNF